MTTREQIFTAISDGKLVRGPIHGRGGLIPSPGHGRLRQILWIDAIGINPPIYVPKVGHAQMYPGCSAMSLDDPLPVRISTLSIDTMPMINLFGHIILTIRDESWHTIDYAIMKAGNEMEFLTGSFDAGYVDETMKKNPFLICRRQSYNNDDLGIYGWTYLRLIDGEDKAMRDIRRIAAGAPPGSSVEFKRE